MNLQVLQENLSSALSITSRFASTRAQLPVLSNILLSTKRNKLLVSATNLEISISMSVGAKIKKEGEITIPARVITDLITNLQPGSVNLKTDKERLLITSQNFSGDVSGMNASDFPSVPQSIGKNITNIPKDEFISALSQVLFAVSSDETRPVLTGVLFLLRKNNFILVATDGFRLSQKSLKTKLNLKSNNLILPKNVLSELVRLSGEEEEIKFVFKEGESQVVFSIANSVLASRIIEGEFPDYERIIPKRSTFKVFLDKEELLRAVKLSSVFARDSANVVKIKLGRDNLLLSAESSQSGSQETQVDAKIEGDIKGKDGGLTIALNYRFLEDFLSTVEGDEVSIELTDANSPGVFKDTKDPDFLHLIMPVRTQG